MSFYENQAWPAPGRQPSWEQPAPPSRSGATSAASSNEPAAFSSQFEDVERAQDNLMKSGKWLAGMPARREMSSPAGRSLGGGEFDQQRPSGPSSRHHSVSEYDGGRSNSAASGLQGFYAAQRFQPRQSEAEQMMQAKRRMAAQRERELRNYHQEQQYNRNASGVKSDRSQSPNTMNEDDRRELIARQHRALYGSESSLYNADGTRQSQDARVPTSAAARGPSPLAFDPFGTQGQNGSESAVQMPAREQMQSAAAPDRRSSASPPSSNPTTFSMVENPPQSSRTSGSSPKGSPPIGQSNKQSISAGSVAPIGTRPAQSQAASLKRVPTPNERSTSAASNPGMTDKSSGLGGWGSNSGVWGPTKNTLGVQASVWG